jgi:polyphosphate glucokinase
MHILGIDIGGSGIKGAPVDCESGELLESRYRIPTPQPSHPRAVSKVVDQVAKNFKWRSTIGCGLPSVIRDGVALTAANIDHEWVGINAEKLFKKSTGCKTKVINDADAAGLAEMRFGAGKGMKGLVFVVTIGSGIGTAMFLDGKLVPNTELGHLEIRGKDAEKRASDAVRKDKNLTWKKWAFKFDEFIDTLERLFWPDLIILGGGASKKTDQFIHFFDKSTKILPAQLKNDAAIVGAALAAHELG